MRMVYWRLSGAWALTVAVLVTATVAYASDGIVLQIKDAPLREVLMLLTQQSGCSILVVDDVKMDKRITANLNNIPLDKALDYVVKSAGVSYKKEDGTYIIGGPAEELTLQAKDVLPALPPTVEAPAPPRGEAAQPAAPALDTRVISVKLVNQKPSDIVAFLSGSQRLGRSSLEAILGSTSRRSISPEVGGDVAIPPSMDPSRMDRSPGRSATERTGAGQMGGPGSYGGGFTGGMGGGGYGGAGGFGGVGGMQRGGGTYSASGGYGTGGYGGYGQGGYGQGGYGQGGYGQGGYGGYGGMQGSLVPQGIIAMTPFDPDNSILIRGTDEAIQQLKAMIRLLDIAPKQVQIKAEFVEVDLSNARKFGIDWNLDRLNESFNTAFNPAGNVTYGFAAGNLTAKLRMELTESVGRIVNAPLITTMNNMDATISIGSQIPYWESTQTTSNGVTTTSYNPQYIDISTDLEVIPRVNADNSITMQIYPSVSDQGTIYTGPDGTQLPETRTQQLSTTRRVRNGETIVLGGFVRKQETNGYQKVPVLSDLPFIGTLFRTENRSVADKELLIFVTPTVLDEGSMASSSGVVNP